MLGASLRNSHNADLLQQVLGPLRNVWASTVAGLIIGGLWGECILFVLKPYTRPALLPPSMDKPQPKPLNFEAPEPTTEPPAASTTVADDWLQKDPEGMY